jgi:hypothetical protein
VLVEGVNGEARDLGFAELRASFLESHQRSRRFFEVAGFTETDRLFWSRLDCSIEPPAWARDRASAVRDAGIEIATAADFGSRRPDWGESGEGTLWRRREIFRAGFRIVKNRSRGLIFDRYSTF